MQLYTFMEVCGLGGRKADWERGREREGEREREVPSHVMQCSQGYFIISRTQDQDTHHRSAGFYWKRGESEREKLRETENNRHKKREREKRKGEN